MEKRKRWHHYLIVAVLVLTLYNILPTIFYYAQPLKKPVGPKEATRVSEQIAHRVDVLEGESIRWLKAFAKTLGLKPKSIAVYDADPKLLQIDFASADDANIFRRYLPQAGAQIPFVPAQLLPGPSLAGVQPNQVIVQRQVATRLFADETENFFKFTEKRAADGSLAPLYQQLVDDRMARVAAAVGGVSAPARLVEAAKVSHVQIDDALYVELAQEMSNYERSFGLESPITKRFFASFTQSENANRAELIQALVSRFEQVRQALGKEISEIIPQNNELLESADQQRKSALEKQKGLIDNGLTLLRTHPDLFRAGQKPLNERDVLKALAEQRAASKSASVDLGGRNPFIHSLDLDVENGRLRLVLYPEVAALREATDKSESTAYVADKLNRLLINTIAEASRASDEEIAPAGGAFVINLDSLVGSQSLLALDLKQVAGQTVDATINLLNAGWTPTAPDFAREIYPISDLKAYNQLSLEQRKLGLLVYAPVAEAEPSLAGFRSGSIYVIARGLANIDQKASAAGTAPANSLLKEDFLSLHELLASEGFVGYPALQYGFPAEFKDDYIFELGDYYGYLLLATRENFQVHGTKQYATLEFTDYEQRLLKTNEIDSEIHEDLIKWADEYRAAQINPDPQVRFTVPHPTRNVLWDNFLLSVRKYFRGDNRKILKWGLDLSGGKTVTIGLRDRHNQPVTDPDELREAASQLYSRVNKMGVSEVEIRVEGNHLVLDFPGAQALSASELVKGSQMFFHIVNEKFSTNNRSLAPSVNAFLQEVWNEAVVTGKKDIESINQIAWEHLGGRLDDEGIPRPRSDAAETLYEHGLRLADPSGIVATSSTFDDSLSSIATFRGESFGEWQGQPTPLLIVFHNYALDGTDLQNVHAEYDPSRGNVLIFGVARSGVAADGTTVNPQADFYAWTSHFAKDRIAGTPAEAYSRGEGWRMAVILNGSVISAPRLLEPLRDHASVTGNFSQREVNALAADFKAGSLTFTPRILSERNVSPELGKEERSLGVTAALVGLLAVIAMMTAYYRFAGVVASCAVIFNLLILWAVLQNLGAALTLPGIAGIILTMGMAVDANVLVFERIREELANGVRLPQAIAAGYRRAFSAILDSNVTTLIAAFILLHFDAGPIRGFAVTLIVGIISSMFTALFMTRYFFAGWVQSTKHRQLKMANLFKATKFDFLSKAKFAIIASIVLIVVGLSLVVTQRHTLFGMDFTGGYSVTVALEEQPGVDYRKAVASALAQAGANSGDVQIRELNRPSHLRIQLGMGLEQTGEPFADLPEVNNLEEPAYSYETNPRIVWVVNALAAQGLTLQPDSLAGLENQWNVMSGQFSGTMRNQAIIGLGLALLAILLYITFRFEFKYGIAALVALVHDLLITVGVVAILHQLGMTVQIDLQAIGALMTIIGYSLNDTIVIFDRIREEGRHLRKLSFRELVNHSLNVTLNRTLMTSGTTLVVLLALVFLGGPAIFDFALVMTLGIIFGTLSSLFIASPVLLYFHQREANKVEKSANAVTKA